MIKTDGCPVPNRKNFGCLRHHRRIILFSMRVGRSIAIYQFFSAGLRRVQYEIWVPLAVYEINLDLFSDLLIIYWICLFIVIKLQYCNNKRNWCMFHNRKLFFNREFVEHVCQNDINYVLLIFYWDERKLTPKPILVLFLFISPLVGIYSKCSNAWLRAEVCTCNTIPLNIKFGNLHAIFLGLQKIS